MPSHFVRHPDIVSSKFVPLTDTMVLFSFQALRFQLVRMLRLQPLALAALLSCGSLLTVASLALASQWQRLETVRADIRRLSATRAPVQRIDSAGASAKIPTLPPFESAPLVAVLNDTATESGLVLDEVRYALDETAGMPYLRYRITMSVNASYPLVRQLAERIQANVPHLTIDAIHCSRKNALIADLSCELALSGLFRKAGPGG